MKKKTACVVCVFACLALLSGCAAGWNNTSDASLQQFFAKHEADFQRLLDEVQADPRLTTLQRHTIIYAGRSVNVRNDDLTEVERCGLPKERWRQYQKELRNLKLYGVMKGESGIEFRVDAGAISNGDSYKGYWYSPTRPKLVQGSLDSFRISDRNRAPFGGWIAHRALKENWYLYIFVND